MILSILDTEKKNRSDMAAYYLRLCRNDLFATLLCALFGCVYERFSFGVYSYFMLYAFLIPLILGGIPFLLMGSHLMMGGSEEMEEGSGIGRETSWPIQACRLWHAGVATLTVGFLFQGVLDIYGTSSGLSMVYWVAGTVLLVSGMARACAARPKGA